MEGISSRWWVGSGGKAIERGVYDIKVAKDGVGCGKMVSTPVFMQGGPELAVTGMIVRCVDVQEACVFLSVLFGGEEDGATRDDYPVGNLSPGDKVLVHDEGYSACIGLCWIATVNDVKALMVLAVERVDVFVG